MMAALPDVFNGFLERYSNHLEPKYKETVRRVLPVYPRVLWDNTRPRTVQHRDFRFDNLLFDVGGHPDSVYILDWGTVAFGSGLADVAYFIGASLDSQQRAKHEKDLARIYFDALRKFPLGDYDWDACWQDYRRFCFLGMFTAVFLPMMVERSERGDELFLQMLRNYGEQIHELGGLRYWE